MTDARIIRVFKLKRNRLAVVLHINRFTPKGYHNGYVELKKKEIQNIEQRELPEEITFEGTLPEFGDIYFAGFDTVHFNDNKLSQSLIEVEQRTLRLAEAIDK